VREERKESRKAGGERGTKGGKGWEGVRKEPFLNEGVSLNIDT